MFKEDDLRVKPDSYEYMKFYVSTKIVFFILLTYK